MQPDSRLFSMSPGRVQPIGRLWPSEDSPEMDRLHADFHAAMGRRSRQSDALHVTHWRVRLAQFLRRVVARLDP